MENLFSSPRTYAFVTSDFYCFSFTHFLGSCESSHFDPNKNQERLAQARALLESHGARTRKAPTQTRQPELTNPPSSQLPAPSTPPPAVLIIVVIASVSLGPHSLPWRALYGSTPCPAQPVRSAATSSSGAMCISHLSPANSMHFIYYGRSHLL